MVHCALSANSLRVIRTHIHTHTYTHIIHWCWHIIPLIAFGPIYGRCISRYRGIIFIYIYICVCVMHVMTSAMRCDIRTYTCDFVCTHLGDVIWSYFRSFHVFRATSNLWYEWRMSETSCIVCTVYIILTPIYLALSLSIYLSHPFSLSHPLSITLSIYLSLSLSVYFIIKYASK